MNGREAIDRARRQGVTLTDRDGYDVVIRGRTPSRRLLRDITMHRAAIVRELVPPPTTCCECSGPLSAGHTYRCWPCIADAVEHDRERWEGRHG